MKLLKILATPSPTNRVFGALTLVVDYAGEEVNVTIRPPPPPGQLLPFLRELADACDRDKRGPSDG